MGRQIEIAIPEPLYQWLSREAQHRALDIPTVIQAVLEQHAQRFDLTQTRTWQLCGAFSVAEPEPEYLVGYGQTGSPITNYSEHVGGV